MPEEENTRQLVGELLRADMANPVVAGSAVLAAWLAAEGIEVES